MPKKSTTFRLRDGCSASAWSAPDGSSLLTLDASSVQMAPDGYRRIVWMIKRMINGHPTEHRCQGKHGRPGLTDHQGASDKNRMPRRATLVVDHRTPAITDRLVHPPDRVDRLTAGSEAVTPCSWAAPFGAGPSFDRRALTKLLQLEQLAQLHLPFSLGLTAGLKREPLGPVDGLLHRLHLEDPVAGDDRLGLAEGAVDHGVLAGGELDPNALGAPMQRGEVQEYAGLRQLLVVLAHLGQELLAGQVAGFPVSFDHHHHPHVVPPVYLGPDADRCEALPGRRTRVGEIDRASEPGLAGRRAAHLHSEAGRAVIRGRPERHRDKTAGNRGRRPAWCRPGSSGGYVVPVGAFLSARMTARGTTSGMRGATPTSYWPMDLYPMGLLARRGLGDRTSYQTGDGRDPVGWEDSFDVQLGLPTRAAGGRPTGVCPTRQQPQPLQPSDSNSSATASC